MATDPRVHDNDRDEITVTLDEREIRGWSYRDETERRVKMLAAREFCEGWFQKPSGIEISGIEVLALKKLALISGALASSLKGQTAAREQYALTKVLIDVVNRADAALASRQTKENA
jgi:hypothetical protein